MAQDPEQTIRELKKTAIGNCMKRIQEAAHKPLEKPASDPDAAGPCCDRSAHGVTTVLKDKYGL